MSDTSIALQETARRLTAEFLQRYPRSAARQLETLPPQAAADVLEQQPLNRLQALWRYLNPGAAESIFLRLSADRLLALLQVLEVTAAATLLKRLPARECDALLTRLTSEQPGLAADLRELMQYPADTAGAMMAARIQAFPRQLTVEEALRQLRHRGVERVDQLFLLDDQQRVTGSVEAGRLVLAERHTRLGRLAQPVSAAVDAFASREEVLEQFASHKVESLPVLDAQGQLVGVITHPTLMQSEKEELAADVQTMVGASRDEKALSSSWFAVRKRLPWLQINLVTAFAAAAVVGAFEDMIARFTALAVLLPVAAGQSGNAGAQALAVTMRGLTLREITTRHWLKVTLKEMGAGLLNGVAIAITCAAGVYLWSRSIGLALVIALAMIVSLVIAGSAGALVPMGLKRLGLDPAQSSSIVLTTVTDIAGFLSFLGIATALAGMLPDS